MILKTKRSKTEFKNSWMGYDTATQILHVISTTDTGKLVQLEFTKEQIEKMVRQIELT